MKQAFNSKTKVTAWAVMVLHTLQLTGVLDLPDDQLNSLSMALGGLIALFMRQGIDKASVARLGWSARGRLR